MLRIAFFTALKEERQALRKAWPMQDSGSLKGFPFDSGERAVALCSGVGPERMASAVEQGLRALRPQIAVLIGFSAGLRRDLTVGEVVCDERGDAALVQALREFPLPLRFGKMAAGGYLHSAEDKREAAAGNPDCLVADMESEAFRQAAAAVPHLVIRAISDDLDSTLPLPFDKLLTSRGFPDEMAILGHLARRPRLVPEVWELAQSSAAAVQALRETVSDIKPLLIRRLLELA
jgi:nucleoside phosphorylase